MTSLLSCPVSLLFSDNAGSSERRLRNLSSPNFREVKTAIDETNKSTTYAAAACNEKPKTLLNTSYSSEEILLQAASSLQGLEGYYLYHFYHDFPPNDKNALISMRFGEFSLFLIIFRQTATATFMYVAF